MGRRAAGGHDGQVGAFQVVDDGQVPTDHVDDRAGYEKRRDLALPAREQLVVVVLDEPDAADAGTHRHADALAVRLRDLETRVPERIDAGGDAVMDERIHFLDVLDRQVFSSVKIFDRTGNASRKLARIEGGNRCDPALSGNDVFPGLLEVNTDRGNNT